MTGRFAQARATYQNYHQSVWHTPIRAETYAVIRICVALCMLTDQLFQFAPYLDFFYGPHGFAPADSQEAYLKYNWRWTYLVFNTDNMAIIWACFALWVAATACMLVGFKTRWATAIVWFGMLCFYFRNDFIMNSGDRLLNAILFILMLNPIGRAWSIDSRQASKQETSSEPARVAPWGVRVLQWQIVLLYFATGVAKAHGSMWWNGTVIHYVLNDVTMTHWSFSLLPLPFAVTAVMTYLSLFWELLFLPLVLFKPTRKWTLFFGIAFHLGITFLIEVGWFSFYTMCLYAAFIPDTYWEKRDLARQKTP